MSTDTNTALALRTEYRPTELGTERLGQILVKSGFFKDTRDEAQAIVKILYGQELGFGPIAAVLGVYIVDGRPSLAAQMIASAIQKSKRYKYRVREWSAKACRIEFFEGQESLGESSFTIEDAATANLAGKATWKQYPKAMLWARAMSQGARAYVPDVFNGAIYTPEELGAEVDAEGAIVDSATGEIIEERPFVPMRERDMVTSADEPIWTRWLKVKSEAESLGIRVSELRLPIDRTELAERGTKVIEGIETRKKKLAEQEQGAKDAKQKSDVAMHDKAAREQEAAF